MCRAFILPNGDYIETDLYDGIHLINGNKMSDNLDIVSRYQEEIDEEKLDELAIEFANKTVPIEIYDDEEWATTWTKTYCSYKAGYRKRAKEER